jgi:hypothetical protein
VAAAVTAVKQAGTVSPIWRDGENFPLLPWLPPCFVSGCSAS